MVAVFSKISSAMFIQILITLLVIWMPSCYSGEYDNNMNLNQFISYIDYDLENIIQYATKQMNELTAYEIKKADDNFNVKIGSTAHGQLIDSQPSIEGQLESRDADIILKAGQEIMIAYCSRFGIDNMQCAKYLSKVKLDQTSLGRRCIAKYRNDTLCIGLNLKYRREDGSCNNLKHSFWGKSNTAYKRLLFPVYKNGLYTYKEYPNPRELSVSLADDRDLPDSQKTIAMAFWTTFIGHDLSHTGVSSMYSSNKSVECCNRNYDEYYSYRYIHPSCASMDVSGNDPFFYPLGRSCMHYVRSVPAVRTDCTLGPREQLNQATHYLDASMIYGSTEKQTLSLRKKSQGQLLTTMIGLNLEYLPTVNDAYACQFDNTCYKSGDVRVNSQPHLTTMHTLWLREHNRITKKLTIENPHWDDEKLFQETRKIIIAFIQHITYNEWLPTLVGSHNVDTRELELFQTGYSSMYEENEDAMVSNSFATAILPFANSMFSETLSLYSEDRVIMKNLSLSENYNRPSDLQVKYFDHLIRGLSTQNTQKVDMLFTKTLTNHLYAKSNNSFGLDILSLDIHRTREHGIPSYTQFRKYCELKDITNVVDLREILIDGAADKLLKEYKSWSDIDLLVGALFEKHEENEMVGPTMKCIILEQFIRTRLADRYFYDLPEVFSERQLAEIRKMSLSRLFCDNGDNIISMQRNAFFKPISNNELLHCQSSLIPKIDFAHWKEILVPPTTTEKEKVYYPTFFFNGVG